MSANINDYVGRESAWHRMGDVTGKFLTSSEILARPAFQYHVVKKQLYNGLGDTVDAWGTYAISYDDVREKNWKGARFLGTVGESYSVIHHSVGFQMLDELVASVDGAHFETAGVIGKGEKVWGLVNLSQTIHVGEDEHRIYLAFLTAHDGTASHQYRMTDIRVVCQNTFNMAISQGVKNALAISHTKNAQAKLVQIQKALASLQGQAMGLQEKLNFLASRMVTRESAEALFDRLFPKKKKDDGEEVDTTRRANIISEILSLYESNDNNAFPEQRGTYYNLLNAVTEYTDHVMGAEKPQRAVLGTGDARKETAFDALMFMAQSAAEKQKEFVYVPAAR